ncbi:hypothetical protein AAHH78_35105, partial [Burkholderia pseudomallei]
HSHYTAVAINDADQRLHHRISLGANPPLRDIEFLHLTYPTNNYEHLYHKPYDTHIQAPRSIPHNNNFNNPQRPQTTQPQPTTDHAN